MLRTRANASSANSFGTVNVICLLRLFLLSEEIWVIKLSTEQYFTENFQPNRHNHGFTF